MANQMRYFFAALFVFSFAPGALAQVDEAAGGLYLSSQRQPIRVSLGALYQQYDVEAVLTQDGEEAEAYISEVSFPFTAFMPITRNLAVSLQASSAMVSGGELADLSGISDAQAALSYQQRIGRGSLVFSLGANLPSGKRELSGEEFETAVLLGQNYYDFRVPSFGQGFNLAPALTIALPVSDRVALGFGGAYQYRGSFKPLDGMEESYDPGDEVLVTGGLDFRLAPRWALSGDLAYTMYQRDKLGEAEVFGAGGKLTSTVQLTGRFRSDVIRLVTRFRSRGKSDVPMGLSGEEEALRIVPNQLELMGMYRTALSSALVVTFLAKGRYFSEADALNFTESRQLMDVGLFPEILLSPGFTLTGRGLYTVGSFTGFEAGVGMAMSL